MKRGPRCHIRQLCDIKRLFTKQESFKKKETRRVTCSPFGQKIDQTRICTPHKRYVPKQKRQTMVIRSQFYTSKQVYSAISQYYRPPFYRINTIELNETNITNSPKRNLSVAFARSEAILRYSQRNCCFGGIKICTGEKPHGVVGSINIMPISG
jgi:hypothetical protein